MYFLWGWLVGFAVGQGVDTLVDGWQWKEQIIVDLSLSLAGIFGNLFLSEWVERNVTLVRENIPMTSEYVWTPLGASSAEIAEFVTLRPGIPEYMRESVIGWIRNGKHDSEYTGLDFLVRFQTSAKTNLRVTAGATHSYADLSKFLRKMGPRDFANLVHFLLSEQGTYANNARVTELKEILSAGGSSYTVGMVQGRYGLLERVPAAVADIVEEVISSAGKASSLLSSAWEKAFGMNKNPSHAYSDAVKAVEVLSCPLFSPNDRLATLGKDINVLRNGEANFKFVMPGSQHTTAVQHVVSMMQLLWHSQTDRHGEENYAGVSEEEAQAAVLLASTLVGWFSKGMVKKVA